MKSPKVIVFALLAATASAGIIPGAAIGGASISSRKQDDFGNYGFNYQIVNGVGAANGRAEVGDPWGNKRGWYTIADIDGRARRVDYVANAAGFRAVVKTNEPGTALSTPAASLTASPYAGPISGSAAVIAHSPVVAAAAPIGIAAGAPLGIGVAAPIGALSVKGIW